MRPRSVNDVLNWVVVVLAFSIPIYRAWVSLAAVLILLLWFFQDRLKDRVLKLGHHPMTAAILVFLTLNLLSLLWSEDPSSGFEYWRKYLYLLLIPAVASSLRPVFARRAFSAFLTSTVLSVAMMPVVIIADIHIRHIHPGNPAATMSHLDYSLILAVAGLLILVHLVHSTMRRRQRVLWILLFLVAVGGLLLNIGRSGQFAFAASLIFLVPFLLRRRSWQVRAAVLVVVGCAVVSTYLVIPRFQERVNSGAEEIFNAVIDDRIVGNQGKRIAGMIVGFDMVRSHPVLGTGICRWSPSSDSWAYSRRWRSLRPSSPDGTGVPNSSRQRWPSAVSTSLGSSEIPSSTSNFLSCFSRYLLGLSRRMTRSLLRRN